MKEAEKTSELEKEKTYWKSKIQSHLIFKRWNLISFWFHFDSLEFHIILISLWFHIDFIRFRRDFTLNSIWFHCGFTLISHCFHFEFTLSSHWISQRVHFDFTFDLKGKGKASRAEREKGKGLDDLLGSFPLGNGHRAYARTNETKRFPGKSLPPNLRYIARALERTTRFYTIVLRSVENAVQGKEQSRAAAQNASKKVLWHRATWEEERGASENDIECASRFMAW